MVVARRIPESDQFMRQGKYKRWKPMLQLLGTELKGKTLGIVGLGRIGAGVAERAGKGMGMKVIYYDVQRNLKFEKEYRARYVSIKGSAEAVRLRLHPRPSASFHQTLDRQKRIGPMKKTAYLINTSRGQVIDEKALVQALNNRSIAGAGLDVYEFEPNLTEGLTKLKNAVLTPHTASATIEARTAMSELAAQNIIDVFQGRKARSAVNPEVYGKKRMH